MTEIHYKTWAAQKHARRVRRFLGWLPICIGGSVVTGVFVAASVSIPLGIIEFILSMALTCGMIWAFEKDND